MEMAVVVAADLRADFLAVMEVMTEIMELTGVLLEVEPVARGIIMAQGLAGMGVCYLSTISPRAEAM